MIFTLGDELLYTTQLRAIVRCWVEGFRHSLVIVVQQNTLSRPKKQLPDLVYWVSV